MTSRKFGNTARADPPAALEPANLPAGMAPEDPLEECDETLQKVTEALVEKVDDLTETEIALNESKAALEEARAALAASQEREREAQLRAMHDALTDLPNRELFSDRLSQAICLARRRDWTLAVMFLDLNGFKKINDAQGHDIGDLILQNVARRLSLNLRGEDTVCRHGGDEFLYLLVNPQGKENIERIANLISASIAEPISVGSDQFEVNASIGVSIYPTDGATRDELIKRADTAMYRAKKLERGSVAFFDSPEADAGRQQGALQRRA